MLREESGKQTEIPAASSCGLLPRHKRKHAQRMHQAGGSPINAPSVRPSVERHCATGAESSASVPLVTQTARERSAPSSVSRGENTLFPYFTHSHIRSPLSDLDPLEVSGRGKDQQESGKHLKLVEHLSIAAAEKRKEG